MLRTPLSLFRTLAFAEAVSWTLLIAGLIVRATTGWAPAVTIGGGIHGFVFLSYGAAVVLVALNNRWPAGPTVVALISAIVPYATIPVELWVHRRGLLAGAWRVGAGADAAAARSYDGPAAWFLRRPWPPFLRILRPPGGAKG